MGFREEVKRVDDSLAFFFFMGLVWRGGFGRNVLFKFWKFSILFCWGIVLLKNNVNVVIVWIF